MIEQKFRQIVSQYEGSRKKSNETLGSLMQKDFKFIKQSEVTENHAF